MKRAIFGPKTARALGRTWLGLGFVFLYLPLLALVLYSFNDSKIPAVWGGFTLQWYGALMDDREVLSGLRLSLEIAFMSACASVLLGCFAAFAPGQVPAFKAAACSPP